MNYFSLFFFWLNKKKVVFGSGICAFSSALAPRLSAESITRPLGLFKTPPFPGSSSSSSDWELGAIPCGMPCCPRHRVLLPGRGQGLPRCDGGDAAAPAVSAFHSRSCHLHPVPAERSEASLQGTFCKPRMHQLINSCLSSKDKLINRPRRFSQV